MSDDAITLMAAIAAAVAVAAYVLGLWHGRRSVPPSE
jgi:hypothetical protein